MKKVKFNTNWIYAILLAGGTFLVSCGNGSKAPTDSTTVSGMDTAGINPDTIPAAEIPPGAPNPGEDSARYGTGAADSSKNRSPR